MVHCQVKLERSFGWTAQGVKNFQSYFSTFCQTRPKKNTNGNLKGILRIRRKPYIVAIIGIIEPVLHQSDGIAVVAISFQNRKKNYSIFTRIFFLFIFFHFHFHQDFVEDYFYSKNCDTKNCSLLQFAAIWKLAQIAVCNVSPPLLNPHFGNTFDNILPYTHPRPSDASRLHTYDRELRFAPGIVIALTQPLTASGNTPPYLAPTTHLYPGPIKSTHRGPSNRDPNKRPPHDYKVKRRIYEPV